MRQGSILTFLQPATILDRVQSGNLPVSKGNLPEPDEVSTILSTSTEPDAEFKVQHPALTASGTPKQDSRRSIVAVKAVHIDRLKTITATLLPVKYTEKFFTECLDPGALAIAYVALYDAQPVGWIRCRLEPFPNQQNEIYQQLYIQALGVLGPFRGIGLATDLLKSAVEAAHQTAKDLRSICAHVRENNDDALLWYEKHQFRQVMHIPQYYRRLKPAGAWLVRSEIT